MKREEIEIHERIGRALIVAFLSSVVFIVAFNLGHLYDEPVGYHAWRTHAELSREGCR